MIPSMNLQGTHMALLEWANSMLDTFPPPGRVTTLEAKKPENLFDGAIFSLLLEILDSEYNPTRFEQSLAASQTRNETRRSMHIIHMGLMDFARRSCPKITPLIKMVDFQDLDRDPTRAGMYEVNDSSPEEDEHNKTKTKACWQVLMIFLCAACFLEDNEKYVNLISRNSNNTYQTAIFKILTEIDVKLGEDGVALESDVSTAGDGAKLDAELAYEAAIANLEREIDEVKRQAGGLRLRLEHLQDSYDELVGKHKELQDENKHLQKQIESEAGNFDRRRLQKQLKENETLIANLENERNALLEERQRLIKDNARLEAAAKKAEMLVDENQELKAQNEELSKKANMADNLRKKVEASKHLEAELTSLRNDRMDLAKTYDQLTNANTKIEMLKRESEAYASKMQGYEIDIANMRDQKLALVSHNQELAIRVSELEHRSQLDEAVVKDLQEKVMMLDPSAVMDDAFAVRPTSLEDELNDSHNVVSMRSLEVQRLQAENSVLKSTIGTETDKGQLVQEMEDLRASRQAIQDRYNDILEKFTVGQKQIDSLVLNMSEKGLVETIQACYDEVPGTQWLMSDYFREEAYSNLRTQVLAEQSRSKQFEKQLELLRQQLADTERALLEARGDCKAILLDYLVNAEDADYAEKVAAVEKSSLDALTELKNTDVMLATSLRAELEAERRKYKLLKDELEAMRKQLVTAFIEKDELRREAEHANRELQKAADGHTVSTDSVKQSEKMEKLRTRYKQLQQVSHFSSDVSDRLSIDEDDPRVIQVDVKRLSLWESLSPWIGSSPKPPDDGLNGFYPYEEKEDGSWTIAKRPVSKGSYRSRKSSASLYSVSSDEEHTSHGRLGPGPARVSVPVPARNSVSQQPERPRSQYEQSEVKNRELDRTLKAVRAGTEASAQKAQAEEAIKNLQRENAMIATAWYDVTSRLQSNHFVLQRRNENPKSWVNKQRQMVINSTPRR